MPEAEIAENPPINPMASVFDSPEFLNRVDEVLKSAELDQDTPAAKPEPPKAAAPAAETPAVAKVNPDEFSIPETPEFLKNASAKEKESWKTWKAKAEGQIATRKTEAEKIRAEHEKAAQELKATRDEIATIKSATPKELNVAEHPEYKRLQQELAERIEKIRELDVREDKQFKAHFDGRMNQQLEIAKRAGGDRAIAVLKLPEGEYRDEQIDLLVSELPVSKGMQIAAAKSAMDQIGMEREAALKDEVSRHDQRRMERESQEKARMSTLEKTFSTVMETAKQNPIYQPREGDEEWNKGLAERLKLAQHIYNGKLSPEDAAQAALWSAAAPTLVGIYHKEKAAAEAEKAAFTAKISELEAELLKLRGQTPGAGAGGAEAQIRKTGPGGIEELLAGASQFLGR
jgi:hypothetical protein